MSFGHDLHLYCYAPYKGGALTTWILNAAPKKHRAAGCRVFRRQPPSKVPGLIRVGITERAPAVLSPKTRIRLDLGVFIHRFAEFIFGRYGTETQVPLALTATVKLGP